MLSSREVWDKIARSFDETRKKVWKVCSDFIDSLPKGARLIDIGCGNGRHLILSSRVCRYAVGIDFSMEMLKVARENLRREGVGNVDLVLADARYLPLKNDSFDYALFVATIHNIEGRGERIRALKEARRVLRKGGRMMVTSWYRWQRRFRRYFLGEMILRRGGEFGDIYVKWKRNGLDLDRFYHLYSKRELVKDVRKSGFKVLDARKVRIADKSYDNVIVLAEKDEQE